MIFDINEDNFTNDCIIATFEMNLTSLSVFIYVIQRIQSLLMNNIDNIVTV